MSEYRPDPEALLARVKEEEARARRGKLKVFFGAAAGVGKTYAMLEAAREQRADGVDVVVGYIETHGRAETDALLAGLEILPRQPLEHRGAALTELDLDGALRRRPAIMLVDELAHTNAPGSRHAKRWQDVVELLDAGIDVYTTVNVQHVESLNDVVAKITGVVMRETVPDSVFEQADEVELIDLPPDDLLQRFREGKVYLPGQAQEALDQDVRRYVHQLDLVGTLDDRVRNRLPDLHARDRRHDVVEALDVLNVDRGIDVDAGGEQLLDVLPPLGVARAGDVRVGQLVDQQEGGAARQGAVEVELLEDGTAILDRPSRQHLQALEQPRGLRAAVGLDEADDDVEALRALRAGGLEHGEGLAHAGRGAEEDLQLPAPLARLFRADTPQQRIGVGSLMTHG